MRGWLIHLWFIIIHAFFSHLYRRCCSAFLANRLHLRSRIIGILLIIELYKLIGGGIIIRDAAGGVWNRSHLLIWLGAELIYVKITLISLILHIHFGSMLYRA